MSYIYSYSLYDLQEKSDKRIIKAAKSKGIDIEYLCGLDLTDKSAKEYEKNLRIFKALFNDSGKDYKKDLWNTLCPKCPDEKWENEGDFTCEEFSFLLDFQNQFDRRLNIFEENANSSFSTERLILRPPKSEDEKLYVKHLITDGDFTLYTTKKRNSENLSLFSIYRPFLFSVFERDSGNMVGVVGLNKYDRKRREVSAQWYIFKPYRNKGYASEAFKALAKRVFEGKIKYLTNSSWVYKYRKRRLKVDFIRAEIRAVNIPSQRTAESCGFEKRYIDRHYFLVEDKFPEDAVVYELTPEAFDERSNQ